MIRRVVLGLVALAAITFTGCATKVTGLKQSETFVFPNIIRGKIAVVGVTSVMDPMEDSRRNAMANLLRTQLLEERKDYNVVPAGVIASKLGNKKYNELMEAYKNEGVLTENWFKALKPTETNNRYVAFARIENDTLTNDRNETHSSNEKGERIPGTDRVVTSAVRTVTASLNIYDLQAGDVAWSGSVTKSLSNTSEYAKPEEIGLVSVIKAIKGTGEQTSAEKYPYPTAPDTSKVLAKVFAGFAENVPKPD